MVSKGFGLPPNPKTSFSDLRAFAGACGFLRAFCRPFRAEKHTHTHTHKKNKTILQSHEHIGVLVVLGKKSGRF